MSIKPLPEPLTPSHSQTPSISRRPINSRFFRDQSGWFVNDSDCSHGPYADKAEAQTALMYYSLRTAWPTEKQLREFVRIGK